MTFDTRVEQDSIGALEVPALAYYGVQALRGAQNFRITGRGVCPEFIKNIAIIKILQLMKFIKQLNQTIQENQKKWLIQQFYKLSKNKELL